MTSRRSVTQRIDDALVTFVASLFYAVIYLIPVFALASIIPDFGNHHSFGVRFWDSFVLFGIIVSSNWFISRD